ncbi:MAG: hypothetical protein KME45_03445 [Stenomitos rutilans HA7619-LM2]|jgi:hypothetical protein|nr:hypothetical protein [Stenomitos rutilans HA7619-LM2]MBW4469440.1 hypothetical protein [Stenomitos rutilans HA7619-LM2]
MRTCNSCVYYYNDRSGSVCNAFHSLASIEHAESCRDYKKDESKLLAVSSRDRWVCTQPEDGWLDIHRYERVYFDKPNRLLPFTIGITFDSNYRRCRYQTFGITDSAWSCHKVTHYEVEREFVETMDMSRYVPAAIATKTFISANIEFSDPFLGLSTFDGHYTFLDLSIFDGHYEVTSNPAYSPSIEYFSHVLSIRRLPAELTILRIPIAGTRG